MQIPPMSVLETLPAPNYINPVEHPPITSIVNLVLLPLCVLVIAMRTFSRLRVSRSFGADDILSIIAMLPTTAFCVISVLAELRFGWTRHVWDVPPEHISLGLQLILTAECLFAASCTLTKLSMLVFVRRMTNNTNSVVRKIALVAMLIIGGQGITFCFIVIFQCNPVSDYWRLTFDAQPNCFNQPANLLAAGIVNTLTDFVVVLIPIPLVLNLKLPMRQQIIMVALFGAGFIVCIAGSLRTYYMYMVSQTYDQTWVGYEVWLTGAIEMYIAILCSSLPALKPLFSKYLPQLLDSLNTSRLESSKRRSTRLANTNDSTSHSQIRKSTTIIINHEMNSISSSSNPASPQHHQQTFYDSWGKPTTSAKANVRESYVLRREDSIGASSSDEGDLESLRRVDERDVGIAATDGEEVRGKSSRSESRLVDTER